jgi:hypothetical protein
MLNYPGASYIKPNPGESLPGRPTTPEEIELISFIEVITSRIDGVQWHKQHIIAEKDGQSLPFPELIIENISLNREELRAELKRRYIEASPNKPLRRLEIENGELLQKLIKSNQELSIFHHRDTCFIQELEIDHSWIKDLRASIKNLQAEIRKGLRFVFGKWEFSLYIGKTRGKDISKEEDHA